MIKLSRLTDYAVVILSEIVQRRGKIVSASSLAKRTGIPAPTVSKILKKLTKKGLLHSIRGTSGGYHCDKSTADITVADIIEAIEGPIALTACVSGSQKNCSMEDTCLLSNRWNPVNSAVQSALAKVSLTDLIPDFMRL